MVETKVLSAAFPTSGFHLPIGPLLPLEPPGEAQEGGRSHTGAGASVMLESLSGAEWGPMPEKHGLHERGTCVPLKQRLGFCFRVCRCAARPGRTQTCQEEGVASRRRKLLSVQGLQEQGFSYMNENLPAEGNEAKPRKPPSA